VLAVPIAPGSGSVAGDVRLGPGSEQAAAAYGIDLAAVAAHQKLTGRAGETAWQSLSVASSPVSPASRSAARSLLVIGVGGGTPADLRTAGAALARAARGRGTVATTVAAGRTSGSETGPGTGSGTGPGTGAGTGSETGSGTGMEPAAVQAFVEGLLLASFALTWRRAGPDGAPVPRVVLCTPADGRRRAVDEAVHVGVTCGRASRLAREIATWPSREKSPEWLAQRAVALAADAGLDCRVRDEHALAREGFGGLVGVGCGSTRPPRLVELAYRPGVEAHQHVVLVGKGITFDTGGLSLKPAEGMSTMKRDVTGGGVVLAVMGALRSLDVGLNVTGLVAAAENAIGSGAQRPGDVVRHPGGRSSEVLNTDAEGRLVLADALAHAAGALDPDVLVDVATLTGAVKVALGRSLGGLFADDDALAEALLAAGRRAGEPLWRLPLVDDYLPDIASDIADARNTGGAAGLHGAGSIAAALFLRPFAGGVPWAHLDLSSVGDAARDADVWTEGPTGFGARVLLSWLTSPDPLAGVRPVRQ
jgi:leucyl aminopeptidase